MNPMKWMRKNKSKIMAVVVVLLMIVFVGGYGLQRLFMPGIKGNVPIAHYYNKKGAITNDDLSNAQSELNILKALGADLFLQSRPSLMRTPDIPSLALLQLLFSESRLSPLIDQEIKRIAAQQQLKLTDWQIDDFFRQQSREKSEILWLLLKAEAREAGFTFTTQEAGTVLKAIVPQMPQMKGMTAEQLLNTLMERQRVDQEAVLQVFADLLMVSEYAKVVTQSEDVTVAQLKYETLRENQSMDVEMVGFNATALASKTSEPAAEALQKQFNAYKANIPFDVTAENPYGFGYKQPPRVQLEWMLLELADVAKQIPVPTQEQIEEYYQRNQKQFTKEVPSDPNDPNSPKVEKLQNYAEVAGQISKQLLETKINERADNILISARDIADANLSIASFENLTAEQMQKLAGDYQTAAQKTSQKFGLMVHAGKTGLISAEDIARNEVLGRFFMTGQDKSGTQLVTMVFAIDELNISRLGPFAPPKPRIYESIGPLRDYMQKTVALVRAVAAEKAAEPCSIDLTYAKKLPVMKDDKLAESNDVYAVKEAVKEDLRKLEAFPIAKKAADALLTAIPVQGWDKALEAVNKQYGIAPAADNNKPVDTFKITPVRGLKRVSEQEVKMMQAKAAHDPVQSMFIKRDAQQKQLIDDFYSLIAPNKTEATNVPMLVEHKPNMTYYVIKSMSQNLVDPNTYQQTKGKIALMQDYVHGQSLGFEHFKADNIIARMNFQWDEKTRNQAVRPELPPEDF